MSMIGTVKELLFDVGTVAAKITLFAVVPLAKQIAPDDTFSFKPDIEKKLETHGLLDDFHAGKITCSLCGTKVTFDNLGGLKENKERLHVICDNPACSLRL